VKARWIVVAALCVLVLVTPVGAHHGQSMYQLQQWLTLEGTAKQVRWTFPHAWIFLEVKNEKGELALWALEGANPNAITEAGTKRENIRPGDQVRVRCHPLQGTGTGCLLGFVTPTHGDTARGHGVERPWN